MHAIRHCWSSSGMAVRPSFIMADGVHAGIQWAQGVISRAKRCDGALKRCAEHGHPMGTRRHQPCQAL